MRPIPLIEATDAGELGGKAVELGAALRAGLPVPGGFALPVALVDAVAARDAMAIAAVEGAFAHLGGRPVAARSSAIGEDSAGASFAGQHATKLNVVSADALIEAVIHVRASGHTEAALAYRKKSGITGAPRVAVVVQQLVHAELAGVLFTRCPMSGRDERVIEAARGLGEAVVAGLVNPEHLRLARDGRVLDRRAADQDIMIVARADGGTEERELADRKAAVLADHHVRALHELAARVEQVFGDRGQDLEFAFTGTTLFLLQRRPMTRHA
jgi:pyruvate,water dikinase